MVDYRKWDKIDYGESDDEKEELKRKQPQVTTLPRDGGGRVTIGPQGYSIHDEVMEEEDDEPSTLPSFAEVNRTILENERKKLAEEELAAESRDPEEDKKKEKYNGEMIDEDEEEEKEFYEMQKQLYLRKEFEENDAKRMTEKLLQENPPATSATISSSSSSSSHTTQKSKTATDHTKNGSKGFYRNDCRNHPYYEWSQNRTEVNLYLYFPFDLFLNKISCSVVDPLKETDLRKMKKKDFFVTYEEREDGNRLFSINYRGNNGNKQKEKQQQKDDNLLLLFNASFLYDIEITGESDNPYDDIIDWNFTVSTLPSEATEARMKQGTVPEMNDLNCFLFEFLIKKKVKIANAILWWKTVFQDETHEVDVNTITERSKNYSEFLNNFQIANEEFLKKVKNFEKTSVDI
jgi:hypothetical protein